MSRARILDITSVKKKDHMTFRGSVDGGVTVEQSVTFGNTYNACLYSPTQRGRTDRGSPSMPNRESTEVFWKGYKDVLTIQSDTGNPWVWRRIVFSLNGGPNATGVPPIMFLPLESVDIPSITASTLPGAGPDIDNPALLQGVGRAARKFNMMTPAQIAAFIGGLYKGTLGVDFEQAFGQMINAAVDKENVRIHSDTVRHLRSGNESGMLKTFKMYTPLNQKMVYADAESGSMIRGSVNAAPNSPLGDVYIFDLFVQTIGAPGELTISGQGTAYWHEK